MIKSDPRLATWPRNQRIDITNGEPIFKNSEDAILYAALIFENKILIKQVRQMRQDAIQEVQAQKKEKANLLNLGLGLLIRGI